MAGDWIKWTKGLARKSEVIGIAAKLSLSRRETAALLMEVWEWAEDQTETGPVPSVTFSGLDLLFDVPGLAKAMETEHWLIQTRTGIEFPKFDRHNGKPAKTRALDAERKRERRKNVPKETGHIKDEIIPSSSLLSINSLKGESEGEIDPAFRAEHISFTKKDVARFRKGSQTNASMSDPEIRYWLDRLNYAKSKEKKWPYKDLVLTAWDWRIRALEDGKRWTGRGYEKTNGATPKTHEPAGSAYKPFLPKEDNKPAPPAVAKAALAKLSEKLGVKT